jgi:hypothetical protein
MLSDGLIFRLPLKGAELLMNFDEGYCLAAFDSKALALDQLFTLTDSLAIS